MKKILIKKRGTGDIESYFVLLKIIIAIGVVFSMYAYISSIQRDTFFDKLYLSRDIAFLMDSVYSSQGRFYIEYKRDMLKNYDVEFLKQRVKIIENNTDSKKKSLIIYQFAEDLNYKTRANKISNSNKITFQKSNNILEISKELKNKIKLISCPETEINDNIQNTKILIDVNDDGKNKLIPTIEHILQSKIKNSKTTKGKARLEIEKLIEESNVIISVRLNEKENNEVKAYISSSPSPEDKDILKKRNRLACLIINELISIDSLFEGGNIIETNPKYLKEEDKTILDNNKISIIVSIEIQNIKNLKDIATIRQIGESIYKGITTYYGK